MNIAIYFSKIYTPKKKEDINIKIKWKISFFLKKKYKINLFLFYFSF
jgi:hypothetical protein